MLIRCTKLYWFRQWVWCRILDCHNYRTSWFFVLWVKTVLHFSVGVRRASILVLRTLLLSALAVLHDQPSDLRGVSQLQMPTVEDHQRRSGPCRRRHGHATSTVRQLVYRLHRMYDMQTIVTDVRGVCLSVCLLRGSDSLCENGWTDQDPVWGEHSCGPRSIVFDGGPDPPPRNEVRGFNWFPCGDARIGGNAAHC